MNKSIKKKSNMYRYAFVILILVNTLYSYSYTEGERWRHPDFPIYYRINLSGVPSGFTTKMNDSFNTWESEVDGWIDFREGSNTSLWADSNGVNTITWEQGITEDLAVCLIWTSVGDDYIEEIDLVFNPDYVWGMGAGSYRVKNVATHEVGHWLSLNDLYGGGNTEKTMYGVFYLEETKKQSLDEDDIDGLQYIYKHIRVPTDYSTIGDAVSAWLTGQTILLESTVSSISETVTIPSSVTLKISRNVTVPSGTLTFSSGSSLVVNGYCLSSTGGTISISSGVTYDPGAVLKSGGTVLAIYPSISGAQLAASSGQVVYLSIGSLGSYPGTVTMKEGVDVIGAGISSTWIAGPVYFDEINSSSTGLSDLRISGGVMFDDCNTYAYLSNIRTLSIDIDNSTPYIEYVELNSWTENGIYAHNNAHPTISDAGIQGHDYGILITNVGTVVAEYIWFCDNYPYDICADGPYESAYTYGCIWSGYPWDYTYGNVSYDPFDETCEGLKKAVLARAAPSTPPEPSTAAGSDPGREAYDNAYSLYRAIRKDLRLDIKSGLEPEPRKYAAEYSEAIGQFKQIVAEYPESRYSVPALGVIADCYRSLGESESVGGYLGGILDNARYESLHLYAQNLLISYHRRTGDIQAALDLSDTILSSSPPEDLACDVLYGKGVIYQHNLGDHDKAVEMFLAVIAQYPDHPTAQSALTRLEIMGESVVIPDKPATEPEPAEELALEGYPNPFNPTATIRFGLPEAGRVTLVVYDLMGREVVRLAEGYRDAGWQAVVWNGRDARGREVPTGIYIARLMTPQGARAIKLVMMK